MKNTLVGERTTVEFTASFINALNRHGFTDFVANLNTGAFGQAAGSSPCRIVTLELKLKLKF